MFSIFLMYSHHLSLPTRHFGIPKTPWCCPPIDIRFNIGGLGHLCATALLKNEIKNYLTILKYKIDFIIQKLCSLRKSDSIIATG